MSGARTLLQRSRDVWSDEETHPAYARILDELAPDEARILLLLLRGGPQPSVDVRTGGPVGMVSSALVAPGMSMIGARAGCRYLEEVPAYLNNLFRLGLIWFSREQLEDPMEYQVVEAQPDVLEAMHSVRFPKVVRRSIHLTPFGVGFCQACLVDPEETPDLRRTRSRRSEPRFPRAVLRGGGAAPALVPEPAGGDDHGADDRADDPLGLRSRPSPESRLISRPPTKEPTSRRRTPGSSRCLEQDLPSSSWAAAPVIMPKRMIAMINMAGA